MRRYVYLIAVLVFMNIKSVSGKGIIAGINGICYYSPLTQLNNYITKHDYEKLKLGAEGGISGLYLFNPRLGLKMNIYYYSARSSRDDAKIETQDQGYYYVSNEYKLSSTGIFLNMLYFFTPKRRIVYYTGAGIGLNNVKVEYSYQYKLSETDTYSDKVTGSDNTTAYGAQVVLGLYYFLTRSRKFSLNTEINLRLIDFKFNTDSGEERAGFSGGAFIIGLNLHI